MSLKHTGIMRSSTSEQSAVKENIQKARRTLYSLMSSGLHRENGLDPPTAIHLMQIYVIPVLDSWYMEWKSSYTEVYGHAREV